MKLSLVVRAGQIRIISLRLEVNRQRARLANDKFIVDSQSVVSVTRRERERESGRASTIDPSWPLPAARSNGSGSFDENDLDPSYNSRRTQMPLLIGAKH